jgi:hypothetical protein
MRPMRRAVWLLGLAAAVLGLPGCTKTKPQGAPSVTVAPKATTSTEPPGPYAFTLAPPEAVAWNGPPVFPDDVRTAVQVLLDRYLSDAILRPLRTAQPAGDLSAIFAPPALDRVNGPDRAGLVDEGFPKPDSVHVESATAGIVGLQGVPLVAAGFHVVLTAKFAGTPVRVDRAGELQVGLVGPDWKVVAYDVRVTRDTQDGSGSTTTVASHP